MEKLASFTRRPRRLSKLRKTVSILKLEFRATTSLSDDHNTGVVAQLADVVLRLDETGVLQPYQFPSSETDVENEKDDANGEEAEKPRLEISAGASKPKSGHQEPKSNRPEITDRRVYATYFESIGILNLVLFIGGGIIFAFCLKFPGKNALSTLV